MAYQFPAQPPFRSPALAWDEPGPGLYDDGETLVKLDAIYAAVSADAKWYTENGGGVAFHAVARWCDEGGQTILATDGAHAETAISLNFRLSDVDAFGLSALKKEALLVLMGEPPELMRDLPGPGGVPVPVLDLGDRVRVDASIRHAASTIGAMNDMPSAAALLSG